ncbi:MAG: trimeric autotransporter adhesin [Actinomycetota bacterium]
MQRRFIAFVIFMLVGAGSAAAASTPPQNTVRPTISGVARQGETLTADPGTWSGTQPFTFTYQWLRCDSNGNNCSNIIGAASKTYTLASADVGNRLRVRVRASNSVATRSATSLTSAIVAAKNPKSIALDVGQSTVVYGGSVTLSGSVANGQAGESVTIVEHRLPSIGGLQTQSVATVQTAADGAFSLAVRPLIHTLYTASTGQTSSNAVSVQVRPRVQLTRVAPHRFMARVVAARSFVGKYGVLQRWSLKRQQWMSLRRVFFTRVLSGTSPTIVSRTVFRARLGGARIRMFIPLSQAVPGYITGFSNTKRA